MAAAARADPTSADCSRPASIAVVGASERPGSFGERLTTEVLRSPGVRIHLVHPERTPRCMGRPCVPSLADVPEPVDLVVLGVPDQVARRAARAGRSAWRRRCGRSSGRPTDSAPRSVRGEPRRARRCAAPAAWASSTPARGIRAIGYNERDDLGRADRADHPLRLGLLGDAADASATARTAWPSVAGQELVTTASDYLAVRPSVSRRPASSGCSWRRCAMPTGCGPGSPRRPSATSRSSP